MFLAPSNKPRGVTSGVHRHAAGGDRGIKGEKPNETDERRKKTRTVPIHSHLIELGLLEHAARHMKCGNGLLFPDVVLKPRKGSPRAELLDPALAVEKFGESIDYQWSKSLKITLDGNPRKLCAHSMRHYVNNIFLFSKYVHGAVRFDLVWHVEKEKEDINTTVYRDDAPTDLKAEAIAKVPRLF